jgi:beta-glucanase (GH16 family)
VATRGTSAIDVPTRSRNGRVGLTLGIVAALSACAPSRPSTPASSHSGALAVPPASYPGYTLVWSDEFNRDGAPDPANWTYELGFVRNRELQWYTPENAKLTEGLLVIEGRRERVSNTQFDASSSDWKRSREFAEYTSASLMTKGLHSWQYGRFEMRGRIDTRPGLWPAFWTLGVSGTWPHNGEIDIMEYYRETLLANVAWGGAGRYQAIWADSRKPIPSFNGAAWSNDFHVWRMDWDERAIALLVDGQLLNKVDLTRTVNQDGSGTNPLRQPHYILVNLAIGGTQGGDPASTAFPARLEVDYIRIYQSVSGK